MIALLICFAIIVTICLLASRAKTPRSVDIGGKNYSLRAEDDAVIAAFCEACGYPDCQQISDREITVPKHWNETYLQYNELQKAQGFDLTPFKGKSAREFVFAVSDNTYLTLLISEKSIIAAHICDSDGGGMRGIQQETAP